MHLKKIVSVVVVCFFLLAKAEVGFAQYLDLKGMTVLALSKVYTENGELQTEKCDQSYNISFTDKILVHNVYKDGYIDASQIYAITNLEKYTEDGNTIFKLTATSGVSGNEYYYKVSITKDGKLKSLVLTQMDKTSAMFTGDVSELRTYKQ